MKKTLTRETQKRNFKQKILNGYKYITTRSHYIETYVNLKRIIRVRALTWKQAIDKSLEKEEL